MTSFLCRLSPSTRGFSSLLLTSRSPSRYFSSKKKEISSINYCSDLVRQNDYEMFLSTLLIPDAVLRTKVMAVRAFNTEVALIRDQVSHKDIGLARLAFWRDAVSDLYQAKKVGDNRLVPKQPTLVALSRIVQEAEVSKKWFFNLLDGRERLMSDAPFADIQDLEAYCDQTVSSIFYVTFEILGIRSMNVDHAASHLGKAIGISNFVRSIPYNAQNRRVLVPKSLLIKHGVSQEDLVRCKNLDKIKDLVFEIASQAHLHYEKAKAMQKSVDKKALPLFLSGVPTNIYLSRLQKESFDPYKPSLARRNGLLPWHLYFKKLTGSYY